MKLFKTASGKDMLSLDKGEWMHIGEEKGWVKSAGGEGDDGEVAWMCRICGHTASPDRFKANLPTSCPRCTSPYIDKFE